MRPLLLCLLLLGASLLSAAGVVSQRPLCTRSQLITEISKDPCYADPRADLSDCSCAQSAWTSTYAIPASPAAAAPATRPLFALIHVNKAAGETLKSIFFRAMELNQWDGTAAGTLAGWPYRTLAAVPFVAADSSNFSSTAQTGAVAHVRCGKRMSTHAQVRRAYLDRPPPPTSAPTNEEGEAEPVAPLRPCGERVLWGNGALGLCQRAPGRACVYVLTLRDPYERALSDYRYFCTDGAEGKKKWSPEEVAAGRCKTSLVDWFRAVRTSPYFLVERLTRGCDPSCGAEIAIQNLLHPCVRYLLVEKFMDGVEKLSKIPELTAAAKEFLGNPYRKNARRPDAPEEERVSEEAKAELISLLREDYAIYNEAVKRYEESWNRPLTSCNNPA